MSVKSIYRLVYVSSKRRIRKITRGWEPYLEGPVSAEELNTRMYGNAKRAISSVVVVRWNLDSWLYFAVRVTPSTRPEWPPDLRHSVRTVCGTPHLRT
jgi:hypothetical protein